MDKGDLVARILGIVVFLVGIAVLVMTFLQAYHLFTAPSQALTPQPAAPGGPKVTTALGSGALILLREIGLLFIMALVGSLIASRGVMLYFGGTPEKTVEKTG